jgi:hypothetical protein
MRTVQIDRRRSIWLIISLATALAFVLTACGANSGSGTSAGSTPPPASTTTSAVNPHGCPSNAVVGTAPTPANVVLKPANSSTSINAHQGDIVEIQLPFGQMWNGPTTSQGVLHLETPAGYAWGATNSCVWRFTAQGTGVTQLNFYGRAMCKKGQMCPQYIMSLPFTINVK